MTIYIHAYSTESSICCSLYRAALCFLSIPGLSKRIKFWFPPFFIKWVSLLSRNWVSFNTGIYIHVYKLTAFFAIGILCLIHFPPSFFKWKNSSQLNYSKNLGLMSPRIFGTSHVINIMKLVKLFDLLRTPTIKTNTVYELSSA